MSEAATLNKCCFGPVLDAGVRVLMLGSLPGEASLAAARYYAHPRNQFWALMGAVLDVNLVDLDYERRLNTLLAHHIGLWDMVASAQRQGSLDKALRDVVFNDLLQRVRSLPNLRAVAFNGKTAAKAAKQLEGWSGEILVLPSSSPALTLSFDQRLTAWLALRQFYRDA